MNNSNLSLYILFFKGEKYLKFGVSQNLPIRIKTLEKYYGAIDHKKSIIMGHYKSGRINGLEKKIGHMTEDYIDVKINDGIKDKCVTNGLLKEEKFSDGSLRIEPVDGISEIRTNASYNLIKNILTSEMELDKDFHYYKGITFEKYSKAKLPLDIFNERGETEYYYNPKHTLVSVDIYNQIMKVYLQKEDAGEDIPWAVQDIPDLINYILAEHLKQIAPNSDNTESVKYERKETDFKLHYTLGGNQKWFWKKKH